MKNNTKNDTIMKTALSAAAVLVTVILSSCGAVELAAPTDLKAADPNPDNPNRIEISWLPVEGADIYYVYRSDSSSGSFDYTGLSVTSAEVDDSGGTTLTRYSYIQNFTEGEGGTFFYRVTAASDTDISVESAMSAAVEASTYSGHWNSAKTLGSAAQLKLAADNSALYAVYSDRTGTDTISAQKYAEDEDSDADEPPMIWTDLTGSPGTTDGSVGDPFSVFISGSELYTVFNDDSSANKVSMQYYHNSGTDDSPSFSWEAVGAAGFNDTAAEGLSAATVGFAGTIYSAFLETTVPQLYKYNSTTESWFLTVDDSGDFPDTAMSLFLLSHNNTLYVGYEDTVSPGLYLRAYDDSVTALQAGGLVESGDIDDGNAVFVSGGGDLYAVYVTAGGVFETEKLTDGTWAPLAVSSGKPDAAAGTYGTLDAHWYNGYLYVFYLDSSADKGFVKYYDEDEGWLPAEKNVSAVTGTIGTDDGVFQLASSGNRLFAGYIENGQACVKILE